MKKIIFSAIVAVVAVGGAFASQNLKVNTIAIYEYYQWGVCDTPIICDDDNMGIPCSLALSGVTIFERPGCDIVDVVPTPQGFLP